MGDRGNVIVVHARKEYERDEDDNVVRDEEGSPVVDQIHRRAVGFYTHWGGHRLRHALARGLHRAAGKRGDRGGARLSQPDYATRILFEEFTRGSWDDGNLGFGLYPYDPPGFGCPDNGRPVLVFDIATQEVFEFEMRFSDPYPDLTQPVEEWNHAGNSWTVEEFIEEFHETEEEVEA